MSIVWEIQDLKKESNPTLSYYRLQFTIFWEYDFIPSDVVVVG